MRVLVACEESQVVTSALRDSGHTAFSCDISPTSGAHPEWHIQGDAIEESKRGGYDLMIAHPPCTYLCVTGNRWNKPEYSGRFPTRARDRQDAVDFFIELFKAPISQIAMENPVGVISSMFRKPDQYVHPYYFGDPHQKKTGLWLKNLPNLRATHVVQPEIHISARGIKSPKWHRDSLSLGGAERSRVRSRTFKGFAEAMAQQWG